MTINTSYKSYYDIVLIEFKGLIGDECLLTDKYGEEIVLNANDISSIEE